MPDIYRADPKGSISLGFHAPALCRLRPIFPTFATGPAASGVEARGNFATFGWTSDRDGCRSGSRQKPSLLYGDIQYCVPGRVASDIGQLGYTRYPISQGRRATPQKVAGICGSGSMGI